MCSSPLLTPDLSHLETKVDLVSALKNPHDPRRFGLLLPMREWLSGLTEENLLSLLGKIRISLAILSFSELLS